MCSDLAATLIQSHLQSDAENNQNEQLPFYHSKLLFHLTIPSPIHITP